MMQWVFSVQFLLKKNKQPLFQSLAKVSRFQEAEKGIL